MDLLKVLAVLFGLFCLASAVTLAVSVIVAILAAIVVPVIILGLGWFIYTICKEPTEDD